MTIQVHNRTSLLEIYDTPGVEAYRSLLGLCIRGAVGALLVYDVTYSKSFASVRDWLQCFREQADPQAAIILIGNKTDCAERREVSFEEGKSYAESEHMLFIETSALNGTNIPEAFQMLTAEALERRDRRLFA
jgi:Ras-related protein Rab-11A